MRNVFEKMIYDLHPPIPFQLGVDRKEALFEENKVKNSENIYSNRNLKILYCYGEKTYDHLFNIISASVLQRALYMRILDKKNLED